MRFDFTPVYSAGAKRPWSDIVKEMREQTIAAEQAGFDGIWIGEHHFGTPNIDNGMPNPIAMCMYLAACTSSIRLGQIPTVITDRHPLMVAEEMAMLDGMSEGRAEFGAGRGIKDRTSIQFNRDADRLDDDHNYALFIEQLEIIVKAWTEEALSYKGQFYTFPVPGWKEQNRAVDTSDRSFYI